jgi:drug/metabolite transporter (DMT)-like permease
MSKITEPSAAARSQWTARYPAWGTAIGALCVSASAVFIDLSHTSPGTASVYRCLLTLPPLLVLAYWEGRSHRDAGPLPRARWWLAVLAGALFAGDMLLWTQAIAEIGAGLSTVVVNLQVVLVPLLAWLVDRELVTRRYLLAVPVVLAGVVLTAGVLDGGAVGTDPVSGTIHAALAAVCYTGFLYLLRRGGHSGQIVRSYTLVTASALVCCAVLGTLWQGVDPAPGWAAIGWLALVALFGQVTGWLLVARSTPHLPSHVGAVLLLLTPVGAVALGSLVLAERPTLLQLAGCVLVLGGAYLAAARSSS